MDKETYQKDIKNQRYKKIKDFRYPLENQRFSKGFLGSLRNSTEFQRENRIVKEISSHFKVESDIQRKRRVWIRANKDDLLELSRFIKDKGFNHLSAVSVTDLIEEKKYELSYHVWSYSDSILLTIITEINRSEPFINSVMSVWETAQIHERELHELFGVKFKGNPDLAPLFLENWNNIPPFRKDFNWRDYVREKFYNKENKREEVYWDVHL